MRKSLATLLLVVGASAFVANLALAGAEDLGSGNLSPKLMNAAMAKELQSRAAKLQTSATTVDTTYVGFTPGHHVAGNNWWSIWSGSDKFSIPTGPYNRPPARGALWDFEPPYTDVDGDSLQGWWPYRNQMTGTGGLTIPDEQRPWRALEYGNNANYIVPGTHPRTFGVIGVWHIDGGNTGGAGVLPPASTNWGAETDGGVKWAPLVGTGSAWMGLRRHGDNTAVDATAQGGTGNPFNEDAMMWQFNGSVSNGGTDKKFPGYGAQMDQMLYRDIDVSGGVTSLTITFQYRTSMSTAFGTNNLTRAGWFVHDPLTVKTGGANPNYIQNNSTVAAPPADSFMVYVGACAEGSVKLSDGTTHTIYDARRRWFGEVVRSNEGFYKELLSAGGTTGAGGVNANVSISGTDLSTIAAASAVANKVRLVIRAHSNAAFDDETQNSNGYSSGGVGAAIVDNVAVSKNGGAPSTIGTFDVGSNEIDNRTTVLASTAWKSTGKPPEPWHHVHPLYGDPARPLTYPALTYEDLCGQVGNPARICNMQGEVIASGNHDDSEASGGSPGTAEQEPFQGIFSPTIQLAGPAVGKNAIGLSAAEAAATEDYYVDYELYTGEEDFFVDGNAWRVGVQSYPCATTTSGSGQHKRWGEVRFPGFIIFNPDKQCFRDLEGAYANGMIKTTNATLVPDSIRIYVGTRQETYRFGISQTKWYGGNYWDNITCSIVDGEGANPVSIDIWQLTHDTFPFNETTGLPGDASKFDTTTALVKSGINVAPVTGNASRFDVPGDTTVVIAAGDSVRVDLVFRILPGPGNYVSPGQGVNSQLKANPNDPLKAPIPTPASGVANFWSNYMFNNGAKGSSPGHPTAVSGPLAGQKIWSPQVWNSARCDTAELNVFNLKQRGVVQPGDPGLFMTTYHETELSDPHRGALGISRNICFVADTTTTTSVQAVICGSGNVPTGVTYPPNWATASAGFNGSSTTKEGTKILPDGLFTPGTHVEYFFRRQDGTSPSVFLTPDTNQVTPQNGEGSTDGHRWQEFSVLPDRWKSNLYLHPVLGTTGAGDACMLYVDQNDRRGNERVWVGVADSIGATAQAKWGAHNGWHAPGDGDPNDPANFVRKHIGSPGTTWDMLGVKASESLNTGTGSIGCREAFKDPLNTQINGKRSVEGPSQEMLNAYYKILFVLTGDLNSSIFGPFKNKSQNDYLVMENFLTSGNSSSSAINRGFFGEGDGFVEASEDGGPGSNFLNNWLGVTFRSESYLKESGNTAFSADIIANPIIPGGLYGIRNACTFTLDVFDKTGPGQDGSFYEPVGANAPYLSGVGHNLHPADSWDATKPWISLLDGWNVASLHGNTEYTSAGRASYFFKVFSNVFSAICDIQGAPGNTDETPNSSGKLFNFMSLRGNPLTTQAGHATIAFGLAKADRVKIQVFDVSGRLVRTLADRNFPAGEHSLTWDGVDNSGRQVARGLYFTRAIYVNSHYQGQSKVTVLK